MAIVILTWNDYQNTHKCLLSIRDITYKNFFVVVVDNGSVDGSGRKIESEFPEHNYVFNEKNLGFAEGNNQGIREVLKHDCEYVFCLNNDTIVDPHCLDILVGNAEGVAHEKFGSFQPKMIWALHPEMIDSAGLDYSRNGLSFSRGGFEPVGKYIKDAEIFGCCGGQLSIGDRP